MLQRVIDTQSRYRISILIEIGFSAFTHRWVRSQWACLCTRGVIKSSCVNLSSGWINTGKLERWYFVHCMVQQNVTFFINYIDWVSQVGTDIEKIFRPHGSVVCFTNPNMHCGIQKNPQHLQPTLPSHVTQWWLARACQTFECLANYRMTQRWCGSALVTHSTWATPSWRFATAMHTGS